MNYEQVETAICAALRDHFDNPGAVYYPNTWVYSLGGGEGILDEFDIIEVSLILDDLFEVDTENEYEEWDDLDDIITTYQQLLAEKNTDTTTTPETKMTEKKYETEIIRRIYDNTEGKYIQVSPNADLPELITVSHDGDFWNNFRFSIDKDMARQLAYALLGAADEVAP